MLYRVVEMETWARTTWVNANTPEEAARLAHNGGLPCDTEYLGDTDFPIEVYEVESSDIGTVHSGPHFIDRSKL